MTNVSPVWLITGCSTGFGYELAKLVIARGWRAVVTARDKSTLAKFVAAAPERVLAATLDVTDAGQISAAVAAAKDRFGRVDVLVNNAGYGYTSSVEEGEEAQIRAVFDANVFGLFAMTRAVLPVMRAHRSGHIINITSVAGLVGMPSSAYYSATKHAVEGFSKALTHEVAALGIKVTCVEPGPFRTDFGGRSIRMTASTIEDYAETVGKRLQASKTMSGSQPGDPVRAAEAMIALTQQLNPPPHLVLGKPGFEAATKYLREQLQQIEAQRETAIGTDFPAA
jgi:NAD(P)-dependent dehydrogenase (short-subunit alcohol dehydrogenase family)